MSGRAGSSARWCWSSAIRRAARRFYALSDCELVAVDEARFSSLVSEARFALRVMQILSRRLRAMDRRYRPEPLIAREPLEP